MPVRSVLSCEGVLNMAQNVCFSWLVMLTQGLSQTAGRDGVFSGAPKRRTHHGSRGIYCQATVEETATTNSSNGSKPTAKIASSVTELIGNTPMVYLNRVSASPHHLLATAFFPHPILLHSEHAMHYCRYPRASKLALLASWRHKSHAEA